MKKLCIIDQSNFDGNPVGGSTTFLRTIIPELAKYYRIYLIGGSNDQSFLYKWSENYLGCANFFAIGRINQRSSFLPNRLRTIVNLYRCRNEIFKKDLQLLYLHQTELVLPFIKFKETTKILHLHGLANPLSVSRFSFLRWPVFQVVFNTILRLIEKNLSMIFSVSYPNPHDSKELKIKRTDIFRYVPVCIDANLFAPSDKTSAREALGISAGTFVLGFVGRLNEKKGIDKGLDIVRRLKLLGWPVCFLVIGDGEYGKCLKDKCSEIGINDDVKFLPARPYYDLPICYNAMDVFLMGSEAEGFPMVILEALACGVPVVSTNVGAVSEIVANGCNGFVTGDNFTEEAIGLLEQVKSKYPEMAFNARESVSPYRSDVIAKQVSVLLDDLQ